MKLSEQIATVGWAFSDEIRRTTIDKLAKEVELLEEKIPEPGDLISESLCPCCGATLTIKYGDDGEEISTVGEKEKGKNNG